MSPTTSPALHYLQARVQEMFATRFAEHGPSDRGDAYTGTIMIAFGVIIAITVGGILLVKFTQKAEDIDVSTPDPIVATNPSPTPTP